MISTWSRGPADENMPESLLVATLECVRHHPWWLARAKLVDAALKQNKISPPQQSRKSAADGEPTWMCWRKQGIKSPALIFPGESLK